MKLFLIAPKWPENSLWGQIFFRFPFLSLTMLAGMTDDSWDITIIDENVQAIKDLHEDLEELGFIPNEVPLVLQCNKRDLPQIVPIESLRRELGLNGIPTFESVAVDGVGVLDGLKSIVNSVVTKARGTINPSPV